MMNTHHTPVLLDQTIDYLITDKSGKYFDATAGFGGHSSAILKELNSEGILLAADVDKDAFEFTSKKFYEDQRYRLYNFNFSQIDIISKIESIEFFDGIFADLGVSSFQLDRPESGFTYRNEAKLDLRMDKQKAVNAADIVNSFSEEDLANIFYRYGEEKNSRRIAKVIVEVRKLKRIETTSDLVAIIEELTPVKYRIKTLSRVFQSLRIYVNDELNMLETFLNKAVDLLKPGGRIVVLAYHSLEDRIVKDKFRFETLECICPKGSPICTCGKIRRLKILTKKPIIPSDNEVEENFRSRSAKLRAAEKI